MNTAELQKIITAEVAKSFKQAAGSLGDVIENILHYSKLAKKTSNTLVQTSLEVHAWVSSIEGALSSLSSLPIGTQPNMEDVKMKEVRGLLARYTATLMDLKVQDNKLTETSYRITNLTLQAINLARGIRMGYEKAIDKRDY